MRTTTTRKIILSGLFLALGIVLPFLTGQIPTIGRMLLPMHIPVLLCGFICGHKHGAVIGFILPLLRFVLFGMPPLMPVGFAMSFELAAYGFLSGILYNKFRNSPFKIYMTLIISMIFGRVVWGVSMYLLMFVNDGDFGFNLFLNSVFLSSIPGIILQLVLIPLIVKLIEKSYEQSMSK